MPTLDTNRALTVAQVAQKAQTSKKLVYCEIERGNLAATRLGTAIRITPESYHAWMAGRRPAPVDEHIAEILRDAPPLTDEQIDDIVAIIRAADGGIA
jgi:excisionase family DNA binding protein